MFWYNYNKFTAATFEWFNLNAAIMFFYYLGNITKTEAITFCIMQITGGYPEKFFKHFFPILLRNSYSVISNY